MFERIGDGADENCIHRSFGLGGMGFKKVEKSAQNRIGILFQGTLDGGGKHPDTEGFLNRPGRLEHEPRRTQRIEFQAQRPFPSAPGRQPAVDRDGDLLE